jgi:hypothetical protein
LTLKYLLMKSRNVKRKKHPVKKTDNQNKTVNEGYPIYPPQEDVYNNLQKDENVDPENAYKNKGPNSEIEISNEKNDQKEDMDLDVPGAELDDAEEIIGSEDEENNYYSIGGDAHENLEEDNGE